VIPGYYPQVISDEEYLLARAGQDGRRGKRATRDRRYVNVFQSLLTHARDGEGFFLHNHGTGAKPRLLLVTASGISGRSERNYSFPYPVFEEAVLKLLREVRPKDILLREKEEASRADVLRAKLRNARQDVAQLQEDLKGGYSKALATVLREKEEEAERAAGELQEELARSLKPAARAWEGFPGLADAIRTAPDPDAVRLRLRTVLRRVVTAAPVLIVRRGSYQLCAVQFFFEVGRRDYLIVNQAKGHNRPGGWQALSLAEAVGAEDLDLRKPAHTKKLSENRQELS
jgi:hypothetical protein